MVALSLTVVLALGSAACTGSGDATNQAEEGAGDAASAASDAASEASDAAEDAASNAPSAAEEASDVATSLAAEASDTAESLAAEASEAAEEVDWERYPGRLRRQIDRWVEEDNCSGLNDAVDRLDIPGNDELVDYVQERIEQAGCA